LHPLSGRLTRQRSTWRPDGCASWHPATVTPVARAGITNLLDAHPSDEPIHLGVRAKFPDGWEANHALFAHLARHRVQA